MILLAHKWDNNLHRRPGPPGPPNLLSPKTPGGTLGRPGPRPGPGGPARRRRHSDSSYPLAHVISHQHTLRHEPERV